MASRELEAVVGADQVRLERIRGIAAHAGQGGGLSRALDEHVDRPGFVQSLAIANVAIDELHPAASQSSEVQLRPAPVQVVEGDHLVLGIGGEGDTDAGADEAGAAGDQDAAHAASHRSALTACSSVRMSSIP